jgi:hypothetical protein
MPSAELNPNGGRRRRVKKLVEAAEPHLEAGEAVHEVVQTQTGESALATAGAILTVVEGEGSGPHVRGSCALMATGRNVYAMKLGGAALTQVEGPELKVPIAEAGVRLEGRKIILEGITFHVMALFGRRAKSFVQYVEKRLAAAEAIRR